MLVTDRRVPRDPLPDAVARAVAGGVTAVMLREPDLGAGPLLALAAEILPRVRAEGALFLVNDRIDVALACGADGVHLRRTSLAPDAARGLLPPGSLLGVSTHEETEVRDAFAAGADYVVFGPVFATPSKAGILEPRGVEESARVAAAAPGPVLALGGVTPANLPELVRAGCPGAAAIRALLAAADPADAARRMRRAWGPR
jgi:thiamine-phosphate pyrophosphorylase